jgi:hypothetical protein
MKRFSYTCILALILLFSFSKTNAQSSIIGNPIKIGNIEVAQYDFRKIPWVDANNSCMSLGDGWRLPTIDELKILYQNRERIGNFKWDSYWSSTKGNIVIAWRLNFGDGMVYDRDNTDNTACVRAVRNSENHQNIQQEKEFNNLIKPSITCTINPSNIEPSGVRYVGGCINGTAEGIGIVTLANGTSIKGLFKNNKLQEGIVESRFTNGYITFGPYINQTYTGIYEQINIQNYKTQIFNLVNNHSVGNSDDYFNIPEPLIYEQSIFPIFQEFKQDKKYPINYHFRTSHKIPNTNLELFQIFPKLNQNGYSNECLMLYDFSNNKIIKEYGNYNNPLEFITFAADYKSFYVYQTNLKDKKIYNVEISTGLIKVAVSEQVQYVLNKIKHGNDLYNGSVIIKSNNKELWKSTELLTYSKEGKELSKLTIHNEKSLTAYAINENFNQIAIREDSKDSTFLSLYSLDSLKFIKRIISTLSFDHNALGFSPSGKYMYFNGVIFKEDSIYYGVHGNIITFNAEENIILCSDNSGAIIAFDLENKKILWRKKLEGVINRTYKTENDVAIITTEGGGVGKMKPNISKINLNYPEKSETFFSLNQKVQDELQAQSLRFKKEKEAQSQNVSKSKSDELSEAEFYSILTAVFEYGNKRIAAEGGLFSTPEYNAWQCVKCGILSRSKKEPCCGEFGDCPKGHIRGSYSPHSFMRANTASGHQCTRCGIQAFTPFDGNLLPKPKYGTYGKCGSNSEHNWRAF